MSVRRRFASPSTEKPRFLCLFQRKSPHNFCTKILHRTSCDRVGWSGCRLPQISPISTDKLHSACEESVFICRADDWQAPRWHLCSSVRSVGEKSTAWPIPHSTLNTSRYRPPTASERVPICRADGAICVIGKQPAWHLCSSVRSVGEIMYRMAHSYIPHLTLHVIDHPLPAKECRFAAPMARSVLLVSSPHGICVPQCDLWAYKTPAWPHSIIPHPTDHSTFNIPRSTLHVQHSTFHIPHSTFHIINSFSRLVSEQPLRLGTYCGGSSHASPHHLWCLRPPKVRIPVPPNAVGQRFSPCSYHCFAIVT